MKKFIQYLLISVFFTSCKDEYTICDLPTAVRMKCGFYHGSGTVVASFLTVTKISSPDPDYTAPMVPNFSVALDPIVDSVQYQISIRNPSIPDTVTFVYTSRKALVSVNCGEVYINDLTRVSTTMNTLDSVKISNSAINTTSGENVRIYF